MLLVNNKDKNKYLIMIDFSGVDLWGSPFRLRGPTQKCLFEVIYENSFFLDLWKFLPTEKCVVPFEKKRSNAENKEENKRLIDDHSLV